MYFNSIEFAIFLPIVFLLFWIVSKNNKTQNVVIVLASYVFYGFWDWRFLSLIIVSSFVDYIIGIKLSNTQRPGSRKKLLYISVFVNLGLLLFFKYYGFFVQSFVDTFKLFGKDISVSSLKIILPVGISFYTFQTMSYTIDIYRNKLQPTKNILAFFAFVSFFPQLVAGPIERAQNLLPQFYSRKTFNYENTVLGLRRVLWGLFKKIVIADNCAQFANQFFNDSSIYSGSSLLLGSIFFTVQIYADFSAYSDIAIGTARMFGYSLQQNFAFPYFSKDLGEFWRRWHISLSSWFRDYVYIPLGGSRGNKVNTLRNIFIIFLVSGFWHGPKWTFIFWGLIHALFYIPLILLKRNRKNVNIHAKTTLVPGIQEAFQMVTTFFIVNFAFIFFRANDVTHAFEIIKKIFSRSVLSIPEFQGKYDATIYLGLTMIFFVYEWIGRKYEYAFEGVGKVRSRLVRWGIYQFIIVLIFLFYGKEQQFIYFQF